MHWRQGNHNVCIQKNMFMQFIINWWQILICWFEDVVVEKREAALGWFSCTVIVVLLFSSENCSVSIVLYV